MGGEEFPRGYCTGTCNPSATTNECGPLGVCVDLRSAGGTGGLCLRKCALGMPSCRGDGDPSGYTCFTANVPGLGANEGVCYPDCARGASCVEGASCDNSLSECYYPCSAVSPTCPSGLTCDPLMHRCVSMH
jgi:hypothetical protein